MATPDLTCACCGYVTLPFDRGNCEACPICCWEDDPVQFADPTFEGGANEVSLVEAQRHFALHGVGEADRAAYARPPSPNDVHDADWRPFMDGDYIHTRSRTPFDRVAYWMRSR